jgi:alpha-mannosidase
MVQEFQAGQRVRAHRGKAQDTTFLRTRSGVVQLSALKIAQDRDGVILRLFNPADTVAKDMLEFAAPFTSAIEVDHAEEPIPGARAIKGGRRLNVSLPKQKIRTYRLRFPQSD